MLVGKCCSINRAFLRNGFDLANVLAPEELLVYRNMWNPEQAAPEEPPVYRKTYGFLKSRLQRSLLFIELSGFRIFGDQFAM